MTKSLIGKTLLDKFYVEEFIESGGMGSVFRVKDLERNVYLAMKVLHADLAEDPSVLRKFKREAHALSKLKHPNIVRFYGMYQTMDFTFLLEDFIDGLSLKELLKKRRGKPLSQKAALTILNILSKALGFAHSKGVVHCDVKPGNVMIDHGGRVYLTDFGIARHADSTTTTLAYAGAAAYMAPEQIKGQPVNAATDVYALGILLYEIMTGRRPFLGNEHGTGKGKTATAERLRRAHLRLTPPDPRSFNPNIPEGVAVVILRALQKDRRKRFTNVKQFFSAASQAFGFNPNEIPNSLSPSLLPHFEKHSEIGIRTPHQEGNKLVPIITVAGAAFLILAFVIFFSNINGSGGNDTSQNEVAVVSEVTKVIVVHHTATSAPTKNPTAIPTERPTAVPQKTKSSSSSSSSSSKPSYCYAKTTSGGLNVRIGPGFDYPIKTCCLAYGEKIKVIARDRNYEWLKFISQDTDKRGWVAREFVRINFSDCNLEIIDG